MKDSTTAVEILALFVAKEKEIKELEKSLEESNIRCSNIEQTMLNYAAAARSSDFAIKKAIDLLKIDDKFNLDLDNAIEMFKILVSAKGDNQKLIPR